MNDVIKHPIPDFAKYVSGGKVDYWPKETGLNWSQACVIGRQRAQHLIVFMINNDNPAILGTVSAAIAEQGEPDGVAIGFWQQMAEQLMTCEQAQYRHDADKGDRRYDDAPGFRLCRLGDVLGLRNPVNHGDHPFRR